MKKMLLAFVAIVVFAAMCGCERKRDLVVYNACAGSWVEVQDGRGRMLIPYLPFGQSAAVDISGYSGSRVELLALGFDLETNEPLGSANTSRYIQDTYGSSITGPSQLDPWEIRHLRSSGGSRGCR